MQKSANMAEDGAVDINNFTAKKTAMSGEVK